MKTFVAEWDGTTRCETCRCLADSHVPDPSRGEDGGRCLACQICPERPAPAAGAGEQPERGAGEALARVLATNLPELD